VQHISRLFSTIAILLVATASVAAHADTFNFSATGSSGQFSGSGTLTATPQGSGQFLITDISGTGVTGLIAPNSFRGNDNLLFPSNTPTVDRHGFSFTDVNGPDHFNVNIFNEGTGYFAFLQDEDNFTQFVPVNFALSTLPAVPEPSTFLLMGTGLFGAAALLRRKIVGNSATDDYEKNDLVEEDNL
jgi:hypothetical protein